MIILFNTEYSAYRGQMFTVGYRPFRCLFGFGNLIIVGRRV